MLLKVLITLILILYLFYKVSGFLFKIVFGGLRNDPSQFRRSQQRRAPDSNLNIDSIPSQKKDRNSFKGGEYVDFEEVD